MPPTPISSSSRPRAGSRIKAVSGSLADVYADRQLVWGKNRPSGRPFCFGRNLARVRLPPAALTTQTRKNANFDPQAGLLFGEDREPDLDHFHPQGAVRGGVAVHTLARHASGPARAAVDARPPRRFDVDHGRSRVFGKILGAIGAIHGGERRRRALEEDRKEVIADVRPHQYVQAQLGEPR